MQAEPASAVTYFYVLTIHHMMDIYITSSLQTAVVHQFPFYSTEESTPTWSHQPKLLFFYCVNTQDYRINHFNKCNTAATVSGFDVRNMITTSDINFKPSQQKQRHNHYQLYCRILLHTSHNCAITNNGVNSTQRNAGNVALNMNRSALFNRRMFHYASCFNPRDRHRHQPEH